MSNYTYIEAIGVGFPKVQAHIIGTGNNYDDLVWDAGQDIPSQQTLDDWIAANPKIESIILTKYQFRKLFTFSERIAIDSAPTNPSISDQNRAILYTIFKDLDLSGDVELSSNPDVASGLNFLEQIGLLSTGRAAQILANQPPK